MYSLVYMFFFNVVIVDFLFFVLNIVGYVWEYLLFEKVFKEIFCIFYRFIMVVCFVVYVVLMFCFIVLSVECCYMICLLLRV